MEHRPAWPPVNQAMPVSDIARTAVVTVPRDATVAEAGARMREEDVGSVVVVDGDAPVGIATDRDVAMHHVEGGDGDDGVERVTGREPVTVDADDGVYDVTAAMADNGVRRLPVVDGDDLAGIVTLDDVVVLLGMEIAHVSRTIRAESPAYGSKATEIYEE